MSNSTNLPAKFCRKALILLSRSLRWLRSPPGARSRRLPPSHVLNSSLVSTGTGAPAGSREGFSPFGGASPGRQAAQGDGDPEGEAVPAGRRLVVGELGDAAQAVAHRVRVHE